MYVANKRYRSMDGASNFCNFSHDSHRIHFSATALGFIIFEAFQYPDITRQFGRYPGKSEFNFFFKSKEINDKNTRMHICPVIKSFFSINSYLYKKKTLDS